MTGTSEGQQPIDERLSDVAVRLEITQVMMVTMIAIMLRTSIEDPRRTVEALRRNILLAMARIVPDADQAAVLTCEEAADRLIDEIQRLARIA